MIRKVRVRAMVLTIVPLLLAACTVLSYAAYRNKDIAMIPQTTYLHLLKNTPFFTALTREQLRWVIDHSREWEVRPGTVVASCGAVEAASDDVWILLDGKWQVDADGKQYPSGNSDAGKWFSATASSHICQLVVTEKSYVMKIVRSDLNTMLEQHFEFGEHLEAGTGYYRTLFKSEP